jgi:hypothetical protein
MDRGARTVKRRKVLLLHRGATTGDKAVAVGTWAHVAGETVGDASRRPWAR